ELMMDTLAAKPGHHLTAEEVWQVVHEHYTAINRSAVYRILELLTRHRLVTQTRLGSSVVHYELAHEHAHHHLVCTRCRRVVQLPASDVATLRRRIFERHGFRLGTGDLTPQGLCVDCANDVGEPPRRARLAFTHTIVNVWGPAIRCRHARPRDGAFSGGKW